MGTRGRILDPAVMERVKLTRAAITFAKERDTSLAATLQEITTSNSSDLAGVVRVLIRELNSGSPIAVATLEHIAEQAIHYGGGSLPHDIEGALPAIISATSAENEAVRIAAWEAAGAFASKQGRAVVDAVGQSTLVSASPRECKAAIFALRDCGTDLGGVAVPWLVYMLEHRAEDVRLLVLQTLKWLGPEAVNATDRLVEVIGDEQHVGLRVEVAKALVAIDPNGDRISTQIRDPSSRNAVIDVLREVGDDGRDLRHKLDKKRQASKPNDKKPGKAKGERDKLQLVAALMEYHNINNDKFKSEPATQQELMRRTGFQQSKVSRLMKKIFDPDGMNSYKEVCRDRERLKRSFDQAISGLDS